MKGSIRFNNDINVEVDVDPSAEEGARLSSAVNLVDGQELGVGGGSDLPDVTPADEGKVLAVDSEGEWSAEYRGIYFSTPAGNISYNKAKDYLTKGIMVACGNINGNADIISVIVGVKYDSESGNYLVYFHEGLLYSSDPADTQMEWD